MASDMVGPRNQIPSLAEESTFLDAPSKELCFRCHYQMASKARASTHYHPPFHTSRCTSCHETHESKTPFLLTAKYVSEWIRPIAFQSENYELCFTCHDENIVRYRNSTTITKFRNGGLNLHFLHIAREQSWSCRVCHDTHFSNREHLMTCLYVGASPSTERCGDVNFTPTGGSCYPARHRELDYDRNMPREYR